ncbi:ODFP1 protein, partial [Scytalopus superciliaris]|nr:ODFP1 protein [Scytalopus superciliaris]
SRIQRFGRILNSSHNHGHLASVNIKGFEPKDVSVLVKDRKVTVLAERREERNTPSSKTCNYKRLVKQFSLPPGVSEDEVTCSV